MATTPIYYVNSPVSGTQYYGHMWNGVVSSGESISVTVKAWSGANGTGSNVTCTTIEAIIWDQTSNAQVDSFTFSSGFSATDSHATTNGHWVKCSGQYTGSGVGSLSFEMTYSTSALFIPTTPSFTPSSGGIGTSVAITGSLFTDATSVEFNGTAASFTVNSDTSITATVPTGATTGVIEVGNPAGSANSSGNFLVAVIWINTGTPASPVWTAAQVFDNTGTPASPTETAASAVDINTGTPTSPVWTPGS